MRKVAVGLPDCAITVKGYSRPLVPNYCCLSPKTSHLD